MLELLHLILKCEIILHGYQTFIISKLKLQLNFLFIQHFNCVFVKHGGGLVKHYLKVSQILYFFMIKMHHDGVWEGGSSSKMWDWFEKHNEVHIQIRKAKEFRYKTTMKKTIFLVQVIMKDS